MNIRRHTTVTSSDKQQIKTEEKLCCSSFWKRIEGKTNCYIVFSATFKFGFIHVFEYCLTVVLQS